MIVLPSVLYFVHNSYDFACVVSWTNQLFFGANRKVVKESSTGSVVADRRKVLLTIRVLVRYNSSFFFQFSHSLWIFMSLFMMIFFFAIIGH